jgi:ribosomal protein L6P/L9E
MYKQKIYLPSNLITNLYYTTLKSKAVFLLKNSNIECRYLLIPFGIKFIKTKKNLFLLSEKKYKIEFYSFYNALTNFIRDGFKLYSKMLIIKGLGYKANIQEINNKKYIRFKLGFSHFIDFPMIHTISFTLKKNIIFLKGTAFDVISNFAKKIKDSRKPNSYHGKGFWYKNDKIMIKEFKKRK